MKKGPGAAPGPFVYYWEYLPVFAHEEQGHAARAGVGADDRADAVDDNLLYAIAPLDLISHKLSVLQAGGVADIHGLGGRILRQLPHLIG